ncbi:hypothetical protein [Streptomyces sp. NPDC047108]|uniref:hypothetical protein n=1 Tax=Streptomyces sp. NPDC047108 TaxID=3155025 RepID=UPI0033E40FBF
MRSVVGALLALRLTGAGLTAAMAGIHAYLWGEGYGNLETIGELFLVNAIVGGLLAVALLVTGVRLLTWVAGVGALFTAGTLAALVLSLTTGLFGFTESVDAPWVTTTLAVESAGTVALAALVPMARLSRAVTARRGGGRSGSTGPVGGGAPTAASRAPGRGKPWP